MEKDDDSNLPQVRPPMDTPGAETLGLPQMPQL
jgi:hypothetical protein